MFFAFKTPTVLVGVAFASTLWAQAPVEERGGSQEQSIDPNAATILYNELEGLRREVSTLRGLVEELSYQIAQLEKQRESDYLDIDRRLLELSTAQNYAPAMESTEAEIAQTQSVEVVVPAEPSDAGASAAVVVVPQPQTQAPAQAQLRQPAETVQNPLNSSVQPQVQRTNTASAVSGEETQVEISEPEPVGVSESASLEPVISSVTIPADVQYSVAFEELKAGNADTALVGFEKLVDDHPDSEHAAEAYYWMGETWSLKGDTAMSGSAYSRLVENFPEHRRAADAAYKLGVLHHYWGNEDKAIQYMRFSVSANGAISSQAEQFLNENYPEQANPAEPET